MRAEESLQIKLAEARRQIGALEVRNRSLRDQVEKLQLPWRSVKGGNPVVTEIKRRNYRKPPAREAQLEERVRDWCKDNGVKRKKMSSPGTAGTLDDYFIDNGRHLWVELKMPGNTPSALQWQEINDIRKHGGEAYWCDTLEQVILILTHQPYDFEIVPHLPPQEEWLL